MVFGMLLGASPYQIILLAQAGNAVVLPLTLVLLLVVVNHTGIMGRHRNSRLANAAGAVVVLVIPGALDVPVGAGLRSGRVAGAVGAADAP